MSLSDLIVVVKDSTDPLNTIIKVSFKKKANMLLNVVILENMISMIKY